MEPQLKERWVAALRSGSYRQTLGRLRLPRGGYCCTGVLADLIDPDGWDSDGCWHGEQLSIGTKQAEAVGLTRDQLIALQRMNDSCSGLGGTPKQRRMSLNDIGAWIEWNL